MSGSGHPQLAGASCVTQRVNALAGADGDRARSHPDIVMLAMVKDTDPVELVRQIEYHLLLGVDHAIIFDQSCESRRTERAVQPYVEAGLVQYNGTFRCWNAGTVVRELSRRVNACPGLRVGEQALKRSIGGSLAAMIAACHYPQFGNHTKTLPLAVPLDDDEYVVLPPGVDLRTVRSYLVRKRADEPARHYYVQLSWYIFGTSGHVAQPARAVVRMFRRRAPVQSCPNEISSSEIQSAARHAKKMNLNPPYELSGQRARGKPLVLFGTRGCTTHACHGPNVHVVTPEKLVGRLRTNACPPAYIAHYSYQSYDHWVSKKKRGRFNKDGTPQRKGDVPELYERVYDDNVTKILDIRVSNIQDVVLRECVANLFR